MQRVIPESDERIVLNPGTKRWITSGLDFREPLRADDVNPDDPVLEGGPSNLILYLATPKNTFQGDELPILESLGKPIRSLRT